MLCNSILAFTKKSYIGILEKSNLFLNLLLKSLNGNNPALKQ